MQIDLNDPQQVTLEQVRLLIASGDDRVHNQLRVSQAGVVWLSTVVGGAETSGLLFRLETWAAGSGYVGPAAAQDEQWVSQVLGALKANWPRPSSAYVDLY